MELIITIVLFIGYIGYKEYLTTSHIKDLELKLLAKTPQEYATFKAIERKPIKTKDEEDDLIDAFDANVNDVLKGRA